MNESSISNPLPAVDFTISNAQVGVLDTDEEINGKIRGLKTK